MFPGLSLQLREKPCDAIGVPRLASPRVDAVSHVTPPALLVGGEGGAPYALRRGQLGAVPVGDVAYALGGQGVAGVTPLALALDQAPCIDKATQHLADPALRHAEPDGQVLTGYHRVVGDEVQRPFLSRADAEGRRSLRHLLGTGQRRPLPLR